MHAKKLLKAEYWTKWDGDIHLTVFERCLDDEQIRIECFGISISDEDKLQFYLKQMYYSNQFDQTQMTTWENKAEIIKTNWDEAKQYFEGLICDFEVYEQNSGRTVGKGKYDSANATADAKKGNELRQYIATIRAALVAKEDKQDEMAANICNSTQKKNDEMAAQLKMLNNAITKLTVALANKENNPNGGGSRNRGGTRKPRTTSCCMGGYCWSHSYHPTGNTQSSATCIHQKEGHKVDATATNTMGGNNYWPPEHCVIDLQRTHVSYAGKSKPAV